MRNILLFFIFFLVGCTIHKSIDYVYPEYTGKKVKTTSQLYLALYRESSEPNHPKYKLYFSEPKSHDATKFLVIPTGSVLNISGFVEHKRFTEEGTEVHGTTELKGKTYNFYKTISFYKGRKKVNSFPWIVQN